MITIEICTRFSVERLIYDRDFLSSEFLDALSILCKLSDSAMRSTDVSVLNSYSIHDLLKVDRNCESFHISFISKVV
nr:MAG TPA: translation initiation factor-like protein [Bacteriophage sp.]